MSLGLDPAARRGACTGPPTPSLGWLAHRDGTDVRGPLSCLAERSLTATRTWRRKGVSSGSRGLDPLDEPLYGQVEDQWADWATLLDPSLLRCHQYSSFGCLDGEG